MEKKEHKMIDSPTLKYGSRDWEYHEPRHTYPSVPKVDEDGMEFSCHDWRRYSADPDIDLSVIINSANGIVGEEKQMIRSRTKK